MEEHYLADISESKKEIALLEARNKEIDDMFFSLYSDKSKGILSEQRFIKLTSSLEAEQEQNQCRLKELMQIMRQSDGQDNDIKMFMGEIRQYAAIQELNETVLQHTVLFRP